MGPEVSVRGCLLLERDILPDELDQDFDLEKDSSEDLQSIRDER